MAARKFIGKHAQVMQHELESLERLKARGIAVDTHSSVSVARAKRMLAMMEGLTPTVVLRVLEALDDMTAVELPVLGDDGRARAELRMVPRNPEHMRWACGVVLDRVLGKPRQQVQAEVGIVLDLKADHLAALERLASAPRVIEHAGMVLPKLDTDDGADGASQPSETTSEEILEPAESGPMLDTIPLDHDPTTDDDPY